MSRRTTINRCLDSTIAWVESTNCTLNEAIGFLIGYAETDHPVVAAKLKKLAYACAENGITIRRDSIIDFNPSPPEYQVKESPNG